MPCRFKFVGSRSGCLQLHRLQRSLEKRDATWILQQEGEQRSRRVLVQDWAERCRSLKRLQGLDARLEEEGEDPVVPMPLVRSPIVVVPR